MVDCGPEDFDRVLEATWVLKVTIDLLDAGFDGGLELFHVAA